MPLDDLRSRLVSGLPLLMESDNLAALRARGLDLRSEAAVGALLRDQPLEILQLHRAQLLAGVDVLVALTAGTTPRVLERVGMSHRAAALTSRAVDLAWEAAGEVSRPTTVAGLLCVETLPTLGTDRLHEELADHADRLAASGCEVLIARGRGSRLDLVNAVVAAGHTDLPVWAVIDCDELVAGGSLAHLVEPLMHAGAEGIIVEANPGDPVDRWLLEIAAVGGEDCAPGLLVAADAAATRGCPMVPEDVSPWAETVLRAALPHARIIGGGSGTTEFHSAALAESRRTPMLRHAPSPVCASRQ